MASSLLPHVALEFFVHQRDVALKIKDQGKGKVGRLLGIGSRGVGNNNPALQSLVIPNVVNARTMPGNHLEVGQRPNNIGPKLVVAHNRRIGVVGILKNLGLGKNAAIRVKPNRAAGVLETPQRLLGKHAKGCGA